MGQKLTVIAWLSRTVKSSNPAFSSVDVPLVSTFVLSSKPGKEAWVEPIVESDSYRFEVRMGKFPSWVKDGTKLSRDANFKCILFDRPMTGEHIKGEGKAGHMVQRLMAIVAEGKSGQGN